MTTPAEAIGSAAPDEDAVGDPKHAAAELGSDPLDLWVERTGTRAYVGRNGRGATVTVGPLERDGCFSPGELLKLSLAACTGMTADAAIARRLGDEFTTMITASGPKDREADRYPLVQENLLLDLSALSEAERTRLLTVVRRAVEEHCTVSRTVTSGTTVELAVNGTKLH